MRWHMEGFLVPVVSALLGAVLLSLSDAFVAPVFHRTQRAVSNPDEFRPRVLFSVEAPDKVANGTESLAHAADLLPHPPDYPPPLHLQASEEGLQEEFTSLHEEAVARGEFVQTLQSRVQQLEQDLKEKQKELSQQSSFWQTEKTGLLSQLQELSQRWQAREENVNDENYEKERLQNEVKLLQDQIQQVRNMLKREQQTAKELKTRLDDVADAMEFQQMEFTTEKKALEANVQEERAKLEQLVNQWESDKQRFDREKETIRRQLEQEMQRLETRQGEFQDNAQEYQEQREKMQQQLQEERQLLRDAKNDIAQLKSAFSEERAELRATIKREQDIIRSVEKELRDEKARFERAQKDLEREIASEREAVAELSERLVREEGRYEVEKANLEVALNLERRRLSELDSQLAEEKQNFQEQKKKLEEQIAEEVRLRKLKKRQMHDRYDEIRAELTALWQGAKREARQEQKRLTERYERKLTVMDDNMKELEQDLTLVRESNGKLQSLLQNAERERDQAKKDAVAMEQRYQVMVSQRNREIDGLKLSVSTLRSTVAARDAELSRYATSYRGLAKLTAKVTGNKLRRLFRRRKG